MFSPEWIGAGVTVAIQLVSYGALRQLVRDHDRRILNLESKIDKWQSEGFPVKFQKAHSAHGG